MQKVILSLLSVSLLITTPCWAPPWTLPVDRTFLRGTVVVDTLIAQQTGRPNAIRKIAYVDSTNTSDSLEIVKGWIYVQPATAVGASATIKLNFYNIGGDVGSLNDSDTDDAAFMTIGSQGTTIPTGAFMIPETQEGWHTISISNGDDGDVRISYYLIVY